MKPLWLALAAVAVGIVAGIGAVIFRGLIGLVHNLLFLGVLSVRYDSRVHTPPGPWGAGIVLAPVLGAAGVVFLVKTFASEARGRGVSEVMDAVYYHQGKIRPIVGLIKALASALTIGSGGSAGREGPILQIGACFGSTLGQALRVPTWQRVTLVLSGAAGGIAATFNTPIGGILFILETMAPEIRVRTVVPMAVATVAATCVGRFFFGANPAFPIPDGGSHPVMPVLAACAVLGLLTGVVSTVFIKAVFGLEDAIEQWSVGGCFWQHVAAMFGVGLVMFGLLKMYGHYFVEGVGYATIRDILSQAPLPFSLLLILFVLKLLVTSLTLGSGASGGVFSPALFLGATLGGAYGVDLSHIFPALGSTDFAVAGMAGVVGGSTGAALAAVVMLLEMTGDFNLVLPMLLTAGVSYAIRKRLCAESIYTLKLARQGHFIPPT